MSAPVSMPVPIGYNVDTMQVKTLVSPPMWIPVLATQTPMPVPTAAGVPTVMVNAGADADDGADAGACIGAGSVPDMASVSGRRPASVTVSVAGRTVVSVSVLLERAEQAALRPASRRSGSRGGSGGGGWNCGGGEDGGGLGFAVVGACGRACPSGRGEHGAD